MNSNLLFDNNVNNDKQFKNCVNETPNPPPPLKKESVRYQYTI